MCISEWHIETNLQLGLPQLSIFPLFKLRARDFRHNEAKAKSHELFRLSCFNLIYPARYHYILRYRCIAFQPFNIIFD